MNSKSLTEKLLNNRIPFPNGSPEKQSGAERLTSDFADKERRVKDFAVRFQQIFPGLNNAEIARRLATTDAVVKNYVDGRRFPNDDLLFSITRVTGVNLHWLLTGTGDRHVEKPTRVFSDEEEEKIRRLADAAHRPFDEQVRMMALAAIEFLEKFY